LVEPWSVSSPCLGGSSHLPASIFFFGVRFEVEYIDLLGTTHRVLCNSGFFQGVERLEDVVVEDV
jgi:hypothetical protein